MKSEKLTNANEEESELKLMVTILRVVLTAPDGSNPFSLFSRLAYNSLKSNFILNNTFFFLADARLNT